MSTSAHKALEKINSKRAKRQTVTKPNYFEVNPSDVDSPEDYDHMMTGTTLDSGDSDFGVETMKRYDEREKVEASEGNF